MISKFAPKREHMLIDKSQITEPLVLIDNTDDYYVTPSGNIYRKYPNGYLKRKTYTSKKNGYIYVTIVERNGKKKSHRLHRIVAKAYIPNPNNYPIVGHKDNVKTNCDVSNFQQGANTNQHPCKNFAVSVQFVLNIFINFYFKFHTNLYKNYITLYF